MTTPEIIPDGFRRCGDGYAGTLVTPCGKVKPLGSYNAPSHRVCRSCRKNSWISRTPDYKDRRRIYMRDYSQKWRQRKAKAMYGLGVPPEKRKDTYDLVYFILAGDGRIKIGRTRNLMVRVRNLQTNASEPLEVIGLAPGGNLLERELHDKLYNFRLHGEWFSFNAIVYGVIRPYLFESMIQKKQGVA